MNNAKQFSLIQLAASLIIAIAAGGILTLDLLTLRPIPVQAQGTSATPGSMADVTGDGAKHQFTTAITGARWIQFICAAGNSGTAVRIGDVNISATRGDTCAAGGGVFVPEPVTSPRTYDLSTWYYLAQSGDKVSITYGK